MFLKGFLFFFFVVQRPSSTTLNLWVETPEAADVVVLLAKSETEQVGSQPFANHFLKRYKMLKMKRTLSLGSLGQTRLSDMIKEMNLNSRNMYVVSRLTWEQSYHQYPDPVSTGCVLEKKNEMEKQTSIHANFTPLYHRSNEMKICIKTFT